MDFETKGQKVGSIPVEMTYRIIELFSAGLYSSPNKAFEELVCNSYDAGATKVAVFVSSDKSSSSSLMWVCDNGRGMDSDGLKTLWKIGSSTKRKDSSVSQHRLPIGKFGIGKLATYVLSHKLTHISKANGEFKAVTMNYREMDPNSEKPSKMELSERSLTEQEVVEILEPLIRTEGKSLVNFNLWGQEAEKSWTMAIMSDLKDMAEKIQEGRLRWILSTALPLNPDFDLFFNGHKIEPSKIEERSMKKWILGKNDRVVSKNSEYEASTFNGQPCVNLPNIKNVHGTIELYHDSLLKGKSQELGRSHGIFIMIRGRLVNLNDPLMGMEALSHGVFNRIRFMVHADELDTHLTSGRESVKDCAALRDLQKYIQRKFTEVRTFFLNEVNDIERENNASYKIARTPASLSRRPLLAIAKKFFSGEIDSLMLTSIPDDLSKADQASFVAELEEKLISEGGIIKDISLDALGSEKPIAILDLKNGKVSLNLLHPFIANFSSEIRNSILPFKLIATNEILTEAFMVELGIEQDKIRQVMERRDQLLREATFSDRPSAPLVAQMIQDSLADPSNLETALYHAFNNLGFQTTKIGGTGKPDSEARAIIRNDAGVRMDYSITLDAKSTEKEKIKAHTVGFSTLNRHKKDYKADYSFVTGIDFEGGMDSESAISKEAKENKVTVVRAKDLRTLVLLASPKQLSLLELKEFFDNCHTIIETSKWIEDLKSRTIEKRPIKELLEAIFKLTKEDDEIPSIYAIRMSSTVLQAYSVAYLSDLIRSLQTIVGNLISINAQGVVSIQSSPDKILECINRTLENDIPNELLQYYNTAFEV